MPKLEQLKSRLVQHQCILAAYSLGTFKASKDLVSEVIKIDGELTDIIMNDTFVQKDIQDLNKRAFASIKRSQKLIETIGSNYS